MKTTITFLAIIASASAFVPPASYSVESEYIMFLPIDDVELMFIDMVHHIHLTRALGRYMFFFHLQYNMFMRVYALGE